MDASSLRGNSLDRPRIDHRNDPRYIFVDAPLTWLKLIKQPHIGNAISAIGISVNFVHKEFT
jgi:hypothetical protein